MKQDFEFVDGKQYTATEKKKLKDGNFTDLVFNELTPMVDMLSGVQRGMDLGFTTMPRGGEDKALSEIMNALLKAATDFAVIAPQSDKVFDNGTICGLGASEIVHTFDEAEDKLGGDIRVRSIPPLSFIWDPWATQPNRQDGQFMGKAYWLHMRDYKRLFPRSKVPNKDVDDWVTAVSGNFANAENAGTPRELLNELVDTKQNRVRLVMLYYKDNSTKWYACDEMTSEALEPQSSERAMKNELNTFLREEAREKIGEVQLMPAGEEGTEGGFVIVSSALGPIPDPATGQPVIVDGPEAAKQIIDDMVKTFVAGQKPRWTVFSRPRTQLKWALLSGFEVLKSGTSKLAHGKFPYNVYISRQYRDDPSSIQGVVRQNIDRQRTVNKMANNQLAISGSTAYAGWLNPESGGAKPQELAMMGAKRAPVIPYVSRPPTQITPPPMSQTQQVVYDQHVNAISRNTGVNDAMQGIGTQQTISGKALTSRKQGGLTINKSRFSSYEDYKLDEARMFIAMIQQYWSPEKMLRVINVAELQSPLGPGGQSIFDGRSPEKVLEYLKRLKNTDFDLVLKAAPQTETERQQQLERAFQLMGFVTSTGRPIGPATFAEIIKLSDMPVKVGNALEGDMQQMQDPNVLASGGQNDQTRSLIQSAQGSRAGGTGNAAPQ
jgi:hypothetical protein